MIPTNRHPTARACTRKLTAAAFNRNSSASRCYPPIRNIRYAEVPSQRKRASPAASKSPHRALYYSTETSPHLADKRALTMNYAAPTVAKLAVLDIQMLRSWTGRASRAREHQWPWAARDEEEQRQRDVVRVSNVTAVIMSV